jgi:hypothetical protein
MSTSVALPRDEPSLEPCAWASGEAATEASLSPDVGADTTRRGAALEGCRTRTARCDDAAIFGCRCGLGSECRWTEEMSRTATRPADAIEIQRLDRSAVRFVCGEP